MVHALRPLMDVGDIVRADPERMLGSAEQRARSAHNLRYGIIVREVHAKTADWLPWYEVYWPRLESMSICPAGTLAKER